MTCPFRQDEVVVARYTMAYQLFAAGTCLTWYLRQRSKIDVPTPLTSAFVMVGYAVWVVVWVITLSGLLWQPSLAIVAASGLWALCSGALVFCYFLSSFVDSNPEAA